ncbi:MAG: sulfatase-like hydrolase/transferase [Rubripirellula sp.]
MIFFLLLRLCPPFLTTTLIALIVTGSVSVGYAEKPNIIFVLADDLGWSELGCYGNGFNETPHLDQLADDGVRFTQAYAAAPVCSPYRAALLTGQHPARIGIMDYLRPNSANALSTSHTSLPEVLSRNGYATGMIGKWHLTGYEYHAAAHEIKPQNHGFQWDFAREVKGVGNGANFWPYVFRQQPIRWLDIPENKMGQDEFLIDRMNDEAVQFVRRHKNQPFFLYLSHYAVHSILNGKPALVQKYRDKHPPGKSSRDKCYLCEDNGHSGDSLNHWASDHNPHLAAMLESIDVGVGKLRQELKELGIEENTIFIFSSDNGGETNVTSNQPLRGGKSELYEGGIRIPLLVSWPSQMPKQRISSACTTNTDFYPTLLEAVGLPTPDTQILDGQSTLAAWRQPEASFAERTLHWHYPLDQPHFLGGRSAGAIRRGNWKLIDFFDSGETELYALDTDISETTNRASEHPELTKELKQELAIWQKHVGARTPSPPLLIQPRQLAFADHFSDGQISPRWFFNKDWSVENETLTRSKTGTETTRIFLKDTKFTDALIRFDFRLGNAQDIRLVTGTGGHYNSVIHIRPDHFFLQTAKDPDGPYFSYRHGECAFQFHPEQWYTMTVEFLSDELIAHVDPDHIAYAKHPIIDKERQYFAFQSDTGAAQFDNVQIFTGSKQARNETTQKSVLDKANRHPVAKTLKEQFTVEKVNAHERLYQNSPEYRHLVTEVDRLDRQKAERFPEVFQSNKQIRKSISEIRKKLHAEDPHYKELLFATFRVAREIDQYVIAQHSEYASLPVNQQKERLETWSNAMRKLPREEAEGYFELLEKQQTAQRRLEAAYPQLFVSDEDIKQARNAKRESLKNNPAFRESIEKRAAAWRAQQDYLMTHDQQLSDLNERLLGSQVQ